jgi:hypothetical protein
VKTRFPANNRRKLRYGLTVEAFNAQIAAQNNRCAICEMVFDGAGRGGPHVDHDHDVYRLRGLLCFKCNHLLGNAQDDPELLKRAAQYLERFYQSYFESVGWDRKQMDLMLKVKKAGHWADKIQLRAELAKLILGDPDAPKPRRNVLKKG